MAGIILSQSMLLFTLEHVCLQFGAVLGPPYSIWTHFRRCYGLSVNSNSVKILTLHVTMMSFHITNFQTFEKLVEYALLRDHWYLQPRFMSH